jgi:Fe2+ transport system protein FeoA
MYMNLLECQKNCKYRITCDMHERYVMDMGIREGLVFSIKSVHPFNGPVVIKSGYRTYAIAREIARLLYVVEV